MLCQQVEDIHYHVVELRYWANQEYAVAAEQVRVRCCHWYWVPSQWSQDLLFVATLMCYDFIHLALTHYFCYSLR